MKIPCVFNKPQASGASVCVNINIETTTTRVHSDLKPGLVLRSSCVCDRGGISAQVSQYQRIEQQSIRAEY